MIKAILFDFGGVLVRTEDQGGRRVWEQRLGLGERALSKLVFDGEAARQATLGRGTSAEVWAHVGQTLGLDAAQLAACQADFWRGDALDTQLVDLLRRLRPRYKTAILSNAWSDAREAFTRQFGLGAVVDDIIISAEEGVAKPDARIYQIAAVRLGVQPAECVFVDDFAENVAGARAAGMRAIHYTAGMDMAAALRAEGVAV
jgi:putative hydrolase of the HAD superfamily